MLLRATVSADSETESNVSDAHSMDSPSSGLSSIADEDLVVPATPPHDQPESSHRKSVEFHRQVSSPKVREKKPAVEVKHEQHRKMSTSSKVWFSVTCSVLSVYRYFCYWYDAIPYGRNIAMAVAWVMAAIAGNS